MAKTADVKLKHPIWWLPENCLSSTYHLRHPSYTKKLSSYHTKTKSICVGMTR